MDSYQQVFKMYMQPDETTMRDVFTRVAKYLGNTKDEEQMIYEMMYSRKFMFNSPTLMNAGTKTPMMSACYVLPLEDDLYSIFTTARDMAMVFKYGGGVGVSLANLRPKGALVHGTGGTSSGSVAFSNVFNTVADVVKQGGKRRGALMVSQMCNHPDVLEFIKCKEKEGVNANFNMSIAVTDEFMESVRDNSTTKMVFKDDVYGEIESREIYKSILDGMYRNGEPGVIFIDTMNKGLPKVDGEYQILTTNPCLAKGTYLFDGTKLACIEDGGNTFTSWCTGLKEAIRINMSDGTSIVCTPDHRIMTEDGWLEAKDTLGKKVVRIGDRYYDGQVHHDEKIVLAGFLYGDGYVCGKGFGFCVKVNENREPDVCKMLRKYGFSKEEKGSWYVNRHKLDIEDRWGDLITQHNECKYLPKWLMTSDVNTVASFLRGLYSANGSVIKNMRVSYKTISKKLASQIQILLSVFGIKAYITYNKPREVTWENGTYTSKSSYNVEIHNINSILLFNKYIGFVESRKNDKLSEINRSGSSQRNPKVESIDRIDEVEVYDFTMKDGVHYNTANGIVVHNCGEQPLRSYESCNLGSINISKFAYPDGFDWKEFKSIVRFGVDALNRVLDKNWYPHPKIKEATLKSRKIGLGIMGFADALAIMGVRYGSKESIRFTDHLFSTMKWEARKRGDDYRNETVLTVAPTGTISFIADCSPGIEPFFAPVYVHKGFNVSVTRVNRYLEAAIIDRYSRQDAKEILNDIKGKTSIQTMDSIDQDIKDIFVCASDIPPKEQVDIMATAQQYVCNAISKTVNVWNGYPREELNGLVMYAWSKGLKGLTFYRDESRKRQVINKVPTLDTSAHRNNNCPECEISIAPI